MDILIVGETSEVTTSLQHLLRILGYEAAIVPYDLSTAPPLTCPLSLFVVQPQQEGVLNLFRDRYQKQCSRLPIIAIAPEGSRSLEILNPLVTIDYPFGLSRLIVALHRAELSQGTESREKSPLLKQILIGQSQSMALVRRLIEQVAHTEANVLILGESGTGKEVVASSLHYLSARQEGTFVPVNCGAIPGELLESELFGHEKGAFTGALSARQGRFEIAAGGTLFLDEIGDMPLPMQVKLLRVLQERTFERVGSNKTLKANVRVIAATHRNLEERIRDGSFREDLFFRLNVFPIELPPLRDRVDDIPLLIHELVSRLQEEGRDGVTLTEPALASLQAYRWPGNVRELANLIERLTIIHPKGIVDYGDLPPRYQMEGIDLSTQPPLPPPQCCIESSPPPLPLVPTEIGDEAGEESDNPTNRALQIINSRELQSAIHLPEEGLNLKDHLAYIEQALIQQAMERSGQVVSQAAQLLQLRRTTLVEKMRKYGIYGSSEP